MFLGLDLYYTGPAQHLRNLDDLDRDLSNVRKLVENDQAYDSACR